MQQIQQTQVLVIRVSPLQNDINHKSRQLQRWKYWITDIFSLKRPSIFIRGGVKLFWQNTSCGFCDDRPPIPSDMSSSTHTHTNGVHTLSQGRRSFISVVLSMKDVYGWSRVSQGFVLGRVWLFVSATFKANVHEHEHEASWVTGPLKSSTMVLPIIHSAQCCCGISYMALCVFVCVCVRECVW